MTEKDVVRKCLAVCGWSHPKLAAESGFKSQCKLTGLLNNNKNGIRMDNLFRMINAMGFEIVVRDKRNPDREFVIDMKEEEV